MTALKIPSESVERLSCRISSDVDPTVLTIDFSLTEGEIGPTTWTAGEWDGTVEVRNGRYTAKALTHILSGLTEGDYTVWARLNGSFEQPVLRVGEVRIY